MLASIRHVLLLRLLECQRFQLFQNTKGMPYGHGVKETRSDSLAIPDQNKRRPEIGCEVVIEFEDRPAGVGPNFATPPTRAARVSLNLFCLVSSPAALAATTRLLIWFLSSRKKADHQVSCRTVVHFHRLATN